MAARQHLLAFFQSGKDLIAGAEMAPDFHHPDRNGVVRFQDENGVLGYLNGKCFSLDVSEIWFLKDYGYQKGDRI